MRICSTLCGLVLAAALFECAFADDRNPNGPAVAETANAHSAPDPADARRVREILERGFASRRTGLSAAQAPYQAARLRPDYDPRVDYAYGLVLLRHLKYREAVEQFESAVKAGRRPYLPTWQALISTRVRLKERDAALKDAEKLARVLADPESSWIGPHSPADGAFWLGRLIAAYSLADVLSDHAPQLTELDALVRKLFDADLSEAYQKGRRSIERDYQDEIKRLEELRTVVAEKKQQRAEQRQAERENRKQQLEAQAENLEMTAKEWQAWIDEQLEDCDKQLERLEKDYKVLEKSAERVSSAMLELQREMTIAQLAQAADTRQRRDQEYFAPMLQLESQMRRYQAQYAQLAAKAKAVTDEAKNVLAKRKAAKGRFEKATGQIEKNDRTLQKWNKLLEKDAQKKPAASAAGASAIRTRKRRLTKISNYLRLDVKAEKQRLLEELGQSR